MLESAASAGREFRSKIPTHSSRADERYVADALVGGERLRQFVGAQNHLAPTFRQTGVSQHFDELAA